MASDDIKVTFHLDECPKTTVEEEKNLHKVTCTYLGMENGTDQQEMKN